MFYRQHRGCIALPERRRRRRRVVTELVFVHLLRDQRRHWMKRQKRSKVWHFWRTFQPLGRGRREPGQITPSRRVDGPRATRMGQQHSDLITSSPLLDRNLVDNADGGPFCTWQQSTYTQCWQMRNSKSFTSYGSIATTRADIKSSLTSISVRLIEIHRHRHLAVVIHMSGNRSRKRCTSSTPAVRHLKD